MISADIQSVRAALDDLRLNPERYAERLASAIVALEAAERDVRQLETNAYPRASVYAMTGAGHILPQALS